jgi:hypothetical protein
LTVRRIVDGIFRRVVDWMIGRVVDGLVRGPSPGFFASIRRLG